jgi:hypothetical protein
LQSLVGDWWISSKGGAAERGRLLWAIVPHVDQKPFGLVAKSRTEPTEHGKANYEVLPLSRQTLSAFRSAPSLPVAGMPDLPDEFKMVFRGKRRPVLVLGNAGTAVEKNLRLGDVRYHTNRTLLVAPYYGAEKWRPQLIEKIRRCTYPQFVWDWLPPYKADRQSILRLDHIQPIGNHGESYDITDHALSENALALIEEQLTWLRTGSLPEDSIIAYLRDSFLGP